MSDFRSAMMASGLRPRVIEADGKWRRCPTDDKPSKRNGAYILHPNGLGYWRNWAVDDEVNSWRESGATSGRCIDPWQIRRQRELERANRIKAMRGARSYWEHAQPMRRIHPYLERKGLTALGCAGLRVHDGLLVVPVWHGKWVVSVQTISPDGTKRFWPGAPVKAGAVILERQKAALTCVSEGLATGLAVYQSVKQSRVIVAFDAGNLGPVVDRMKPTGAVVICADNDHGTEARRGINPGLEKAHKAAESIGCGVAYPQGIEGTDFADWLRECGSGSARAIERCVLAGLRYVSGAVP